MIPDLEDLKVTDRETLAIFISPLRNDLLENEEKWENKTLDDFLEALESEVFAIPRKRALH
jgi:hypothetical protein